MPRYYFDLREDRTVVEDEEGLSLPDIDAAQREVAESANIGATPPRRSCMKRESNMSRTLVEMLLAHCHEGF